MHRFNIRRRKFGIYQHFIHNPPHTNCCMFNRCCQGIVTHSLWTFLDPNFLFKNDDRISCILPSQHEVVANDTSAALWHGWNQVLKQLIINYHLTNPIDVDWCPLHYLAVALKKNSFNITKKWWFSRIFNGPRHNFFHCL